MADDAPVFTARMAAVMRASHLLVDDAPPIFDDPYALAFSEFRADEAVDLVRAFEPEVAAVFRATTLVRARFTDEQVEAAAGRGVDQYVILGAGLDSFAWRRPVLMSRLRVFEVDHPGTQAYKLDRVNSEGLTIPDGAHFVPVDFTSESSLAPSLREAGFRADRPTVWSWLGVMLYLNHDQIGLILADLAEMSAPGSVLVADFLLDRALMDGAARVADDIGRPGAAEEGEQYISSFNPERIAALVARAGWPNCRTWIPTDLANWFANRTDHLGPSTYIGLLVAEPS